MTWQSCTVTEAMLKAYKFSIETYEKPPKEFLLGIDEYKEFVKLQGFKRGEPKIGTLDIYMDVQVRVVPWEGVGIMPPTGNELN